MRETLAPIPLDQRQINQAYPIVQTLLPTLSLDEWRRYALRLIRSRSPAKGVMTAQYAGYIRGLFCHWPHQNLCHGEMLIVDNFAVMDMFDPEAAARVLIRAMEDLATGLNCRAIHTLLSGHRPTPLHGQFHAQGHWPSKVVLCKSLYV